MFELLGFVVDLVPAHAHHLHEKELDQAVPSQHEARKFFTRGCQADAAVRLVFCQP